MNRLFLSDLHLDDPLSPHFQAFARLLDTHRTKVEEIYLLGDLCEVWIGDDDDSPLASELVAVLSHAAVAARVFIMPGNRDFLFGADFARNTGAQLIPDPYRLDERVLLSHGDAFCVDDQAYQSLRAVLRSPAWQEEILARSLEDRRALAVAMREQSAATNANKAENIMDVSAAEVSSLMAAHQASVLIHGHTHRPGVHQAAWGRRFVLGAWERCGWAVRESADGALALKCFPLAGRCEI